MPLRTLFLICATALPAAACEACKAQQPRLVRGLVHGAAPQGVADYLVVALALAGLVGVAVLAVRCLARPAEQQTRHIKRTILHDT